MARIRTIKPEFFRNDALAECDPLARLLFVGLWTLADCEGRLEDRPKRIKAELLAYDDCDIESLLAELCGRGFISRYRVGEMACIEIPTFRRHQRITGREAEATSEIPANPRGSDEETLGKHSGNIGETSGNRSDATGETFGTTGKERKGREGNNPPHTTYDPPSGDETKEFDEPSRKLAKARESSGFQPPTKEEVGAECTRIGLPQAQGLLFYAHHETRAWRLKGGAQMAKWRAALQTWKLNWESGRFEGDSRGSPGSRHPEPSSEAEIRAAQEAASR